MIHKFEEIAALIFAVIYGFISYIWANLTGVVLIWLWYVGARPSLIRKVARLSHYHKALWDLWPDE